MIAQPVRILDPLRPVQQVAFGDLIDFARYSKSRYTADVCDACNTINPASAKFCKGCSGKMPAFYASTGDPSAGVPAARRPAASVQWIRGRVPVGDWMAAVLLILCAGFGPWLVGAALIGTLPPLAIPAPQPLLSKHFTGPEKPTLATLSDVEHRATAIAAEAGAGADTTGRDARPEATTATSSDEAAAPPARPPHRATATPSRALRDTPARTAALSSPVMQCSGLDFLSRAVCMNNRCAQDALSNTAQCAPVNRQRRMDEARRNPQLVG